jgi:hypothetical protein
MSESTTNIESVVAEEGSTATPIPREIPKHYDMDKYFDRFCFFYNATHPRNLLTSKAQMIAYFTLLQDYKVNGKEVPKEALWEAHETLAALLHPTTYQPISRPLSYAAFLPRVLPQAIGSLYTAKTPFNVVFW